MRVSEGEVEGVGLIGQRTHGTEEVGDFVDLQLRVARTIREFHGDQLPGRGGAPLPAFIMAVGFRSVNHSPAIWLVTTRNNQRDGDDDGRYDRAETR